MSRIQRRTRSGWSRRFVPVVGAMAMLATIASGCGDLDDSADRPNDEGAQRPTITIVTYDSYVLEPEVEAAVEEALDVDLVISASGDGAEALAAAILTAGRPAGDIFFGVDNVVMSRALSEPVFVEFDRELVPNLDSVPEELHLDSTGRLVPINVGPVCVDYDTGWFAERGIAPPTSFEELADPQYASLLVLEDPVTSTPGLAFLMATGVHFGNGAEQYWRSLLDGGALVVGGWSEAWYEQYSVSGGERPLVLSYASSPPAEVFYSDGEVAEPASGVVEATCVDQVEFAGVLAGSAHEELATRVLNEMLSLEWQQSLPLANFVYPARPDAELPELFVQFAPRPSSSVMIDPAVVDEHRDDWIDTWRSIAG